MRLSSFRVALLLLLSGIALYSQTDSSAGILAGRHYENKRCSLTLDIPAGWQPASAETAAAVTNSVVSPERVLLIMETIPDAAAGHTVVTLRDRKLERDLGNSAWLGKVYGDTAAKLPNVSVLKEPVTILLGGLEFYRTDLKTTASGQDSYFAIVASGIKDRILVFQVQGPSQTALDEAVKALVGSVDFAPTWSVPEDQIDKRTMRVRVSSGVAEGILQKKVQPTYPAEARDNHIQGSVRMHVIISRAGTIERIWVLEGHPLLAEAAVDAVHRWKWKPYVVNGEPVLVHSTVTVNFNLR